MVRIDAIAVADLQVLIFLPEVGAAHGSVIRSRPLHGQRRVDEDAELGSTLAKDPQRILAPVDEALGVYGGAAEDLVVPDLDVVAHQFAGTGGVQHRASLAQGEVDSLHWRAGQLVDHRDVLLAEHRWLVAIEVAVAGVVVEHDAGSVHDWLLSCLGAVPVQRLAEVKIVSCRCCRNQGPRPAAWRPENAHPAAALAVPGCRRETADSATTRAPGRPPGL